MASAVSCLPCWEKAVRSYLTNRNGRSREQRISELVRRYFNRSATVFFLTSYRGKRLSTYGIP